MVLCVNAVRAKDGVSVSSANAGSSGLSASSLQHRQDQTWTDVIGNFGTVVGASNLRAGATALYLSSMTLNTLCDKDDTGKIVNRLECMTSNVAGFIFGVYGVYRLGNGFIAASSPEPTYIQRSNGNSNTLLSFNRSMRCLLREVIKRCIDYQICQWPAETFYLITFSLIQSIQFTIWKMVQANHT